MNRVKRHLLLACFSVVMAYILFILINATDKMYLLSMGTAYTGLVLLAATLAIGPLNLIQKKSNPVSSYFRRDVGIWAGIVSLIHMFIGLEMHFGGTYWKYFLRETDAGYRILFNAFGLANYTGLIVGVLCVVLLYMSNNISIKKYGTETWKKIQRYNYALFALVIGHGFLYQIVENRSFEFVVTVGFVLVIVVVLQWKGYRIVVKR